MKITQAEIIQLLRKRSGYNQGRFGAKAFNTSFESGRTKMKNIELGHQRPTLDDLTCIADTLEISISELMPDSTSVTSDLPESGSGIWVCQEVLDGFQGLDAHLDLLNKAAKIKDPELIEYIAKKTASLLLDEIPQEAANG